MSSDYRVPALVSAMKILRELSQCGEEGATASELVRATGLSKSSMHNLLGTLVAEGLVSRNDRSRAYSLGPALIALGAAASGQARLLDVANEKLAPLATNFELTFAIAKTVSPTEVVVIERFYPPTGIHVGVRLGVRYGISEGAIGKCLLAAHSEEEAARLLAEVELEPHTASTITDPEALLEEVRKVRQDGYAISIQELNENNAVAAPVYGRNNGIELIIFALGFPDHMSGEVIDRVGSALVTAAAEIRTGVGLENAAVTA